MMTLYGLAKCSTCLKACAWLDAQHVKYVLIDYRDHPIAPVQLIHWSKELGGWEKLINRASMTWRNLTETEKVLSDDHEWVKLIARYPALIRRPLTHWPNGSVTVGFNEKRFAAAIV